MKRRPHHIIESDTLTERAAALRPALRLDTSALCASGDKCVSDPPSRVAISGEQCRACLRCQADMRARLRARRG